MNKSFEKYVSNYDLNNKDIKRKYTHSYRVMKLSKKYAELLGWNQHDIELATIIGLLHDIGRFEQLKKYHTYNDTISIDHAAYGVKELFEKKHIKNFWTNEDDYEIIKFAIFNHNKYEIANTKNKRAILHAKLIRDTDKIDILYLMGTLKEATTFSNNKKISSNIKNDIYHHHPIKLQDRHTENDRILLCYAYAFNIYNNICLEELKKNLIEYANYVDKDKYLDEYFQETINYINKRLKKKKN